MAFSITESEDSETTVGVMIPVFSRFDRSFHHLALTSGCGIILQPNDNQECPVSFMNNLCIHTYVHAHIQTHAHKYIYSIYIYIYIYI